MTIQIALCDDEQQQLDYLKQLVNTWAGRENVHINITNFSSAEAFLFDWSQNKGLDILLLDIQMGAMDGIALAKQIRVSNDTLQIVFITGFPDYSMQGYEVGALHYLMKPVNQEKLSEVLNRALKSNEHKSKTILFTCKDEIIRFKIEDIWYLEAFAHNIELHTNNEIYPIKINISQAEDMLGKDFLRSHRSYLVNMRWVKKITKTRIVLDTGKELPLSRRLYLEANQAFIRFFRGEK